MMVTAPIAMDAEGQRLVARLPALIPPGAAPAVLVTVFSVAGSAPRRPGARMLCRDERLIAGTIGGGHLELQALRDAGWLARSACADADAPLAAVTEWQEEADPSGRTRRLARYPLGPKLAQCCGGVVWLHFQEVDPSRAAELAHELTAARSGRADIVTAFGDALLRERPQPVPTVVVFGAGHVAAALARVLQPLPWRTVVVDERPEWADPVRFPHATEVVAAQPLGVVAAWGWLGDAALGSKSAMRAQAPGRSLPAAPDAAATSAVVMTHEHALDRDLVEALLLAHFRVGRAADRLAFVGMIGSASKVAATHQRLVRRGVPPPELARLVAPIGLRVGDRPLGGKLPGEIAIAIAAQLIALQPPP